MTYYLLPVPKMQFFDPLGYPLAGGFVYAFKAGTNTPLDTYDDTGMVNTNPAILDSGGMASIWVSAGAYKITVKNSLGVTLYTVDNIVAVPAPSVDASIPSAPTGPTVTSNNGIFVAEWESPTVGGNTLDDVCIQYDTVNTFSSANLITSIGWGPIFHREGYDANKIYYFRFAWHNKSGAPSNAITAAAIYAGTGVSANTGWGPFSSIVGPVSSYPDAAIPGAPVDPTVVARFGTFVCDWADPATGNKSLDDVCVYYATDSGFTTNIIAVVGLGKCYHREGYDPGKTYYFKIAWHNQSQQASNAATKAALLAFGIPDSDADYGWGAFCNTIGPVVSTSALPLASQGAGADPTTSDIASGDIALWHDSTGYHIWANDGGIMRQL